MHGFWKRFGTFDTLRMPEDGAGGGGMVGSGETVAEPAYVVPQGVGAGDGANRQDGNATGAPTSGAANPASGGEPAGGASRDGAQPQTPNPNAPAAAGSGNLPAGRSEEIAGRQNSGEIADLRQQLASQKSVIDKIAAVFAPPATTRLDPRSQGVRDRLLEVMPELKELIGLPVNELKSALQAIPAFQRQHDTHWNSLADRTMSSVHSAVVPYLLGAEGKVDQLNEDQKYELALSFRNWCLRDNTGARVTRYEQGDVKIVDEFRDYYAATHHAPAHRTNVAAAAARSQAGQNVPRAGRADATGTPVPQANPADEDAVHNAAWKHVKNALHAAAN